MPQVTAPLGLGWTAADALASVGLPSVATKPPVATGFSPLDEVLHGGLLAGDFLLLGGKPGVGKTVAALQFARHQAMLGRTAVFACYEHQERLLLFRLLMMGVGEAAVRQGCDDQLRLETVRDGLRHLVTARGQWDEQFQADSLVVEARERLRELGRHLLLCCVSTGLSDLASLTRTLDGLTHDPALLVVDYLQKVPATPSRGSAGSPVAHVAEELKRLAISRDLAVVAVAATGDAGLASRRVRMHHLRDSSAVGYEADIVLILNHKMTIVSRLHLAYDTARAYDFRNQIVFSVEKHRSGVSDVDLEFRHDFANFRFDPRGHWVSERLSEGVDE